MMKQYLLFMAVLVFGVIQPSTAAQCNSIKSADECETSGCFFCADSNKCRTSEDDCNGNGNTNGNGNGNGNNGGGENKHKVCNSMDNETACADSSCFWCAEKQVCRKSEDNCPGNPNSNNGGVCNDLLETECLDSTDCFWCSESDTPVCRASEEKCPGGGGGSGGGGGGGGQNANKKVCNRFQDLTSCSADEECFWCQDKETCRGSSAECPGQGRVNPCKGLEEVDCTNSETCSWCGDADVCTSSRGGGKCPSGSANNGNNTGGSQKNEKCMEFVDEAQCISTSTSCRWCPVESKCKKGQSTCDDGSAGVRGNPCKDATELESCGNIQGCLWCEDNSKCKKASDGCEEEDESEDDEDGDSDEGEGGGIKGNPCKGFDFDADCPVDVCQFCAEQEKCKKADDVCDEASETAELDIDYEEAQFTLRNDGLGPTDPNQVSVKIKYIFETAADGETEIDGSFVDLEYQTFDVKQVQGTFFDGIQARKVSFEANIDGVGELEMDAYIMLSDGIIASPSGEVWDVAIGDVKFNIEMSNWNFCSAENPCGSSTESSGFIDLAVEVQGKFSEPEQDDEDALIYNLGEVPMILSNQIEVDSVTDAMPLGFPRLESNDEGSVFVFRFPVFDDYLEYDPILKSKEIVATQTDDEDEDSGVKGSTLVALIVASVLVVCGL